ncbi:hypothetical protein ACFW17_07505 [Streptomyces sp. NPDC058961]|uniref:hypothetical protein n=1 Tax=Streptomyces sp. NPDC058961 TaxID=3346680 RepID=UPI0036C297C5
MSLDSPIEDLLARALPPAYDRTRPSTSAPALVNWHLRRLRIGDIHLVENGGCRPLRVEGQGWCRAEPLHEAFWPGGADLCVSVMWAPDEKYWRRYPSGSVPRGAEQHWRDRTLATIEAVESAGFIAEERGPRRTPHHHPHNRLLVYQMPPHLDPVRQPADAWAGIEPCPPNHRRTSWYPQRSPEVEVQDVLAAVQAFDSPGYGTPEVPAGTGSCYARDVTQLVWPVGADLCTHLIWKPSPEFRLDPDGVLPAGALQHWNTRITHITDTLNAAGWQLRQRARPWDPHTDSRADLLAWRPAQ